MKTFERDIVYKGEVVSHLKFKIHPDMPDVVQIHHEVEKWSPEIYKEHVLVWQTILDALKAVGIVKVVCGHLKTMTNPKMIKYWESWGFSVTEVDVNGLAMIIGEREL